MKEKFIPLGLLCLLSACQPEDLRGSVSVYVNRYDESTHRYRLEVSMLENLESLSALRGRDVELRSGAGFSGDFTDVQADFGHPFSLQYTVDGSGTVVPAELQDLYAVTFYQYLDRVS